MTSYCDLCKDHGAACGLLPGDEAWTPSDFCWALHQPSPFQFLTPETARQAGENPAAKAVLESALVEADSAIPNIWGLAEAAGIDISLYQTRYNRGIGTTQYGPIERITPKYRRVVLSDFSGYIPEKGSNGGAYGYWIEAYPVAEDSYHIEHFTTSDFGCDEQPNIISEQELTALIREYSNSSELECKVEPWTLDLKKLRRRCEDALRKSSDTSTLLAVASRLGVSF